MTLIQVDGSCYPNPGGEMGIGIYDVYKKYGESYLILKDELNIAEGTNNIAELLSLKYAILYFKENYKISKKLKIQTDSKLMVGWIEKGRTGDKGQFWLENIIKDIIELKKDLDFTIFWLPRETNTKADELSNKKEKTIILKDWDFTKEIYLEYKEKKDNPIFHTSYIGF